MGSLSLSVPVPPWDGTGTLRAVAMPGSGRPFQHIGSRVSQSERAKSSHNIFFFSPPCQRRGSTSHQEKPAWSRQQSQAAHLWGHSCCAMFCGTQGASLAPSGCSLWETKTLVHNAGGSLKICKSKLSFDSSGLSFLPSPTRFSGTSHPTSIRPSDTQTRKKMQNKPIVTGKKKRKGGKNVAFSSRVKTAGAWLGARLS